MATQTILITALPNGYSEDGQSLQISLLISPRLEPDINETPATLATFPDFVDWPATISQSRFELTYNGSTISVKGNSKTGPARLDKRLGLPDSDAWTNLFPDTTFVEGHTFRDLTKNNVLSFPAEDMDQLVRGLYQNLAASAVDQLPTPTTLLNEPTLSALIQILRENDRAFSDQKTGLRDVRKQFNAFRDGAFKDNNLQAKLALFELFHTPSGTPHKRKDKLPPGDTRKPAEWIGYDQTQIPAPHDFQSSTDFHRMVAAMNQHPVLLRRLGLVIDILIPRDAFAPAAKGQLSAEVVLPEESTVKRESGASPVTTTLLNANQFQSVAMAMSPALGGYQIVDGLLDLDPKTFALLQADVDGSSLKMMNLARTLMTLNDNEPHRFDPVTRREREMGAPSLRNAGLMLVHKQRGRALQETVARQKAFNDTAKKRVDAIKNNQSPLPKPPAMFTQDLVRGYRIDIWDDVSKGWHSLCERKSIYDIADGKVIIKVPSEEGTVRLAATTSVDKSSNPDIIWLHETLVSWAGWSLCAPPPGKTIHHQKTKIDDDGNEVIVHEDPVGDPEAEVPPDVNLATEFVARPGTLPRLRYGRRYWIRARAVDLAGNSLAPQLRDFGPEQTKARSQGYFRFDPISAPSLALVKPAPGETEIPEEGESMERIAVRSFNDTPALNSVPSTQRARRFALPNRTTQREAEQHGMFDRDGVVDPAFYATLVAQDNSLVTETVAMASPLAGDPVDTSFAVMVEGDDLPYLPDPLAVEVVARIFDLPGFPSNKLISVPFYDGTEWPEALPFKIEIYEDPADSPHYDSGLRTFFVPLPKAARAKLRLSMRPRGKALSMLGVWNWLTSAQQQKNIVVGGQTMTLEKLAHYGQHWMLTPWRNVELVHAVQRPLITPEIKKFKIGLRSIGDTFIVPGLRATCSIASTDRLDLRAKWNEPVEANVPDTLPGCRTRIDHAFSVKITEKKDYADPFEYAEVGQDLIQIANLDRPFGKTHEFHDTRYRRIEYWLEGTTKFREFLPSGLLLDGDEPTEEHIRVVGPTHLDWVPCSAPPPAPEVLYVVPTFGWVRSGDEATKHSWRRGGGLRVYLNRPWNASGYGEMLAVVMPGASFTGDPETDPEAKPAKNFVTQWGIDPVWVSANVTGISPKLANFPLARTKPDPDGKWLPKGAPLEEADQRPGDFRITSLSHPDFPNTPTEARVDIAPHDVFYDEERQLWYCDIEVTWGASYFPFIRLALARYQPDAISRAHLSNVVLADFIQLIPDRWLTVTHTGDARTRNVRVFGSTYSDSGPHQEATDAPAASLITPNGPVSVHPPDVAATSVVEVWVERFTPALGEDFGWSKETHAIVVKGGTERSPGLNINAIRENVRLSPKKKARVAELTKNREYEALLEEDLVSHVWLVPPLWEGNVTLPKETDARFRLAIAEYEEYIVDDADNAYDKWIKTKGRRLVFMEYVDL